MNKMTIQELQKELGLTRTQLNKKMAEFFDLTYMGYMNSSAKKRYETALCRFYAFVKSEVGEEKENKTAQPDNAD